MTSPATAGAGFNPTPSAKRSAAVTVEVTRSVPWVRDHVYPDCWPRGAPPTPASICWLTSRSTSLRPPLELIGIL
jgi:hypothetical protein